MLKFHQALPGLLLTLTITFTFCLSSGVNTNEKATLPSMVYGTAEKPFVLRRLVPDLIRGIRNSFPEAVARYTNSFLSENNAGRHLIEKFCPSCDDYLLAATAVLVIFFLFGIYHVVMIRLMEVYITGPPVLLFWGPILSTLLLVLAFTHGYIYDPATLALSAGALYALSVGKVPLYLCLFSLAAYNRETAILLILLSAAMPHTEAWPAIRRPIFFLGLQLVIFAVIRSWCMYRFIENPGGRFEFHLYAHLEALRHVPLAVLSYFLAAAAFITLAVHKWRDKPLMLRLGGIQFFLLLPLHLVSGYPFEIRVFYEAYPALFLLAALNFAGQKQEGAATTECSKCP